MASVHFHRTTIAVRGTVVLRDIDLEIDDGEFVGVVGPTGSGKTALLRTVAGLTDVVSGHLDIGGRDATDVLTARRDVAMVFQSPMLMEHRNVRGNVAFPLEVHNQVIADITERVGAEVRALHVEHLLRRHPSELSRGEAQLVQIARALVRVPSVLLLDEPLNGLDAGTQHRMRAELKMLQRGYGVTTLMAANGPSEAMMPDRLAVIDRGVLVQVDTPQRVWESPATLDAAAATGECRMLRADVVNDHGDLWLRVRGRDGTDAVRHRAWAPALAERSGQAVTLMVRPDDVKVSAAGSITARVTRLVVLGSAPMAFCDVGGQEVAVHADNAMSVGDVVPLRLDRVSAFDLATGRALV